MKNVVSPKEAAAIYLSNVARLQELIWKGDLIKDLEGTLKINIFTDNEWAYIYFLGVYIAITNQSLDVHFSDDEATVLRSEILKKLEGDGEDPMLLDLSLSVGRFEQVIHEFPNYEDGFPVSLDHVIPPFANLPEAIGLAYAECSDVDFSMKSKSLGVETYNIFFCSVLGDFLFLLATNLNWKQMREEYDVEFE